MFARMSWANTALAISAIASPTSATAITNWASCRGWISVKASLNSPSGFPDRSPKITSSAPPRNSKAEVWSHDGADAQGQGRSADPDYWWRRVYRLQRRLGTGDAWRQRTDPR